MRYDSFTYLDNTSMECWSLKGQELDKPGRRLLKNFYQEED